MCECLWCTFGEVVSVIKQHPASRLHHACHVLQHHGKGHALCAGHCEHAATQHLHSQPQTAQTHYTGHEDNICTASNSTDTLHMTQGQHLHSQQQHRHTTHDTRTAFTQPLTDSSDTPQRLRM